MFVSLTEVALSTPPPDPPAPAPTPALHSLSRSAQKQSGGATGCLVTGKRAATEQSRGESASAQGWSTNNNKGEVCGGGRGAPNGWDRALGMLMRQGTFFCLFPSSE